MANRNSKITGKFPDFGAIFMSNGSTRAECLRRSLFGLPSNYADFVKGVKDGMILFLFDYEKRKLYGVFKATSDGELNICSNAYGSTGKLFPAQVKVTRIWNCHPLSEDEFHHAIRSNYYVKSKFNLGLSYDQVYKLLRLFKSRKVRHVESQSCIKNEVGEKGRSSHKKQKAEKDEGKYTEKARKKPKMDTDVKSDSNVDPLTSSDKCLGLEGDSQSSASRISCKASHHTFPEASCFQPSAAYVSSYSSTSSHGLAPKTTEKCQVSSGEDASGHDLGTHFDHTAPKCQVTSGEDASGQDSGSHFDHTTPIFQVTSGGDAPSNGLSTHFDHSAPVLQVTSGGNAPSHELSTHFVHCTEECQVHSGEDAKQLDTHISARSLQGEFGDDFIPLSLSSSDDSDTEANILPLFPCELDPTESETPLKPRFLLKSEICLPCSPIEDQTDLAPGIQVKGLYSDSPQKRDSVFCRMELSILKGRRRTEKDDKPEKRASVFTRLNFSSKPQDKVRTEKDRCAKDDQSVTEIMGELQKRFGNGTGNVKRARSSRGVLLRI